jgi:hypothetical protein
MTWMQGEWPESAAFIPRQAPARFVILLQHGILYVEN